MRRILPAFLVVVSLPLAAQTPYLVKDLNTTYSNATASSSPTEFAAFGNRTFFVATTTAAGTELWSTDGTSAGTAIVSDIIPGPGSSAPSLLQVVNGSLLFNARDVNHGIELWTTDGTAAGTHLLTDINPGPSSSQPAPSRILYKNRLLFSADDGTNGRELWTTDGTAAGTRMLKDINPGTGSSSPSGFALFGDSIYFGAFGGLWKTDGTEAGTVKVASLLVRSITVSGSQLFIEGFTSAAGWELCVSDGTESGTHIVADILPGRNGALDNTYAALGLTAFRNGVLFPADDGVHGREMWFSDGTAAGTRMVRDFVPGATGMWDSSYAYITAFGDRAYFVASDKDHGQELWSTDGTDGGTAIFADLSPGSNSSYPSSFTATGGKLYFLAVSANGGLLLWVTDGTAGGTQPVSDSFGISENFFQPRYLWPIGGKLYFAGITPLTGSEPWVSDGTAGGSHLIANLAADRAPSADPHILTAAGNLLFFFATEGATFSSSYGQALWRTDGTDAGTVKLFDQRLAYETLTPTGGPLVFFQVQADNRFLLNMSDGTVAGTKLADDFLRRFGQLQFSALFPFGDTLFATVDLNPFDSTLWRTTATPDGTAVNLGVHLPFRMIDFAGKYAFYAAGPRGLYDYGLWITDGTPAGTYAVIPDLGATEDAPSRLINADGTLFFLKTLRQGNMTLWKSDGTADGTIALKTFAAPSTFQAQIKAAGANVFIVADGSLWVSDGSAAGTIELTKITPYSSNERDDLRPAGNRIVYVNNPSSGVYELWGSDGTKAGTKLLKSLGPNYTGLTSIDGVVYFTGVDDAHGAEAWTTDGTVEGTKLLFDLNPGAASSNAAEFTKVGNLIYFAAYTDATGGELWALPLTAPALSIAGTHGVEGDAGRSLMHFNVTLTPAAKQTVTVDYATSDGTAKAGDDYDAASGTLTFAAGETLKTIDISVRGDVTPENNETFLVTLRNANGARIANGDGAGIIDDDDQIADLAVVPEFSESGSALSDAVIVSNAGPRAATSVIVNVAITAPYDRSHSCYNCSMSQLYSATSAAAIPNYFDDTQQVYVSATVTARERDPQPSNNTTAWTMSAHHRMAMNAPYLTPGATAIITASIFTTTPVLTSSDPSVVSISSTVRNVSPKLATWVVTALKPGASTMAIQGYADPLLVTVVAAGTQPRWPRALTMLTDFTALPLDKPMTVTAVTAGTAPFTGAKATGTIVVTAGGKELARAIVSSTSEITFSVYLQALGDTPYTVTYSGDSNFLPQTLTGSVFVYPGRVTMTGALERTPTAGSYTLTVHAAGSPAVAPTGTISVMNGATEIAKVTLVPFNGISTARVTLTNLPASPTLTINYAGDALYQSGSQQVRLVDSRQRSVRH
jgi:ELWxxDGT repeat protein